jgi:hypothetical protein
MQSVIGSRGRVLADHRLALLSEERRLRFCRPLRDQFPSATERALILVFVLRGVAVRRAALRRLAQARLFDSARSICFPRRVELWPRSAPDDIFVGWEDMFAISYS